MSTNSTIKAKLMLIAAMSTFGTIGIFRRYIPLPSSILAMSRGFIGALYLLVFLFFKRSSLSWKAIKANLLPLLFSGIFIGINWILLFESYQYASVSTATLCYYMAPVFVILASPFVLKEALTLRRSVCVVLSMLGMVLVSGVFTSGLNGRKEFTGILFGLGAALFYATVILMNKKISNIGAYDKCILQLSSAAIILLPYVLLTEEFSAEWASPVTIFMLLFVGIVHTGIAYVMYFGSLAHLDAQTVALFSYIDPAIAIFLSALLLREPMGIAEIIGAILILGATLLSELPLKTKAPS